MPPTINKDLANAVKTARGGKPMQFAMLPKGTEGKLLVGMKLSSKQIDETKRKTGATAIFKGRCIGEAGTLFFEVAQAPPPTLLAQLKNRLKVEAGIICPVEIRVKGDAEAEPVTGNPEATSGEAASRTPKTPQEAWERAVAEIEPSYTEALRDHPDNASTLRAIMDFAQGKAEKEDFPGALAALEKLTAHVDKLAATQENTPVSEPETPDLEAEYQTSVKKLTGDLKKAITSGTEAGKEAGVRFSESQLLARKQDFPQALALLKVVEERIQVALKSPVSREKNETAVPPTGDQDPAARLQAKWAEWKSKLAEWTPAIKAALLAKGQNAPALAKLMAQATALSKMDGGITQALAQLTECQALATAETSVATTTPQMEEKEENTPTNTMALWNRTKDKVDADINRLCDTLRQTQEGALVEAADKLAAAMGLFKVDLTTALMNFDNALGEQKQQMAPKARKVLASYKKSLLADRLLDAAEQNPFVPIVVKKPLLAVLEEIQKALEGKR